MTSTGAKICLPLLALLACQKGPAALNAPVTRANHKFPIASGPHAVDCNTCHGAFQSFTQFTCLTCHGHEQPLTDMLHVSLAKAGSAAQPDGGVGYTYDSTSCLQCHAAGKRVPYSHAGITATCTACHDSGAPFAALPVAGVGLDGGTFAHPPTGGSDCRACHTVTTWLGAGNAPLDLLRDPARDVSVNALVPSYVGTSIAALSPQTEALPMPMNHQTTDLPAARLGDCASCHANANSGAYFPGAFHSSLANSVPVVAQPTLCLDCHAASIPTGFVGPVNAARIPASGEMRHDAAIWNAAGPTTTSAVPYDCAVCHQAPSQALAATWATGKGGTTPALFHTPVTTAGQPQPTSCLACHANSRPNAVLTSANSTLPPNLSFDHAAGPALADCVSCHTKPSATQWTSWSLGRFHPAGGSSPTSCLPCHTGERPVTTSGWISQSYQNSPFDYVTNASGITHGDGQDCATCHRGPGTGAWDGTQNWAGGSFTHGPTTISGTTCLACHVTQRPTAPVGPVGSAPFDHSLNGTGDCTGCHQATVAAGSYLKYLPLPGGDWKGGVGYPGSTPVGSPNQFVTVTETNLNRSAPGGLVTGTSSISATLYNMMLHVSTAVPPALNAGPTGTPDSTRCWHCHTNTNGTVTAYADGKYHASLSNYSAVPGGTVAPFPQPTSHCADCHVQMRPAGIVMKAGSDLQPMDHNALFTAPATIGGVQVTGVAGMDCASCHHNPGITWSDGQPAQAPLFHANIGAAVPQDCTACHYPVMADAGKADLANGINYSMRHRSAQITSQNCQTCHGTALSKAANTPIAAALWQVGAYHSAVSPQPQACADCHSGSEPAAKASTQSSWAYTLASGSTSTNQAQWMNHGSGSTAGKDCVACHAADARTSGSAWNKGDSFHGQAASVLSCKECHGLTNGGGSLAGDRNNLPAGLTNSPMLTSASADATTGVPAGTHDQIVHTDINVSARDCNFCHTQAGISTVAGIQGREWAQASFHVKFTPGSPLVLNGTTGRCSSCHMNVKPLATFTALNHSSFSATSGTQDCSSCHSWPGTGTSNSPNWFGAAGSPQNIPVGGFTIAQPPAAGPTIQSGISNLPHPTVGSGVACTACHATSAGGKSAIGYDHVSPLINTNCASCHEAGTNLVGALWNGATAQGSGAGDSRPYTLASVTAQFNGNSRSIPYPNHFYPVDCNQCHVVPAGLGNVTTGAAYTSAWVFPHTQSKMTNPSTCVRCHTNGIP